MNDHINAINELFKLVGPLGDLSGIVKQSQQTSELVQKTLIVDNKPIKNDKFAWFDEFCKKSQKLQQLFTTCLDDLDSIHSTCQAQNEEFKRIQDKYNLLSHNISQLQDLISGFERHYEHYRRYNVLNRILDGLESESHKSRQLFSETHLKDIKLHSSSNIHNNTNIKSESLLNSNITNSAIASGANVTSEAITNNVVTSESVTNDPITNDLLDKSQELIEGESSEFMEAAAEIGGELAKIISSSHDSIDFFTLHPNYIQSDIYKSYYIELRNRAFNLSIRLFKEVYSKIEFNSSSELILDVSKHFLHCRVYATKLRSILDVLIEKTKLGDIVYENHLDELQLYYVAMRIKSLHAIFEAYLSENQDSQPAFQVEAFRVESFQKSLEFTTNLSNLEISLFSTTFCNSGFQRLKSIIYSLSLSFTDNFKPVLENLTEMSTLSDAIDLFQTKVPSTLANSDAFDPLYKAFEALEKLLKVKFSTALDGVINPLLDYDFSRDKSSRENTSRDKFDTDAKFSPTVDVVDVISANINRVDSYYAISKLKQVIKLVIEVGNNLESMDKHLFIIKNLHYIKDNLPIERIYDKLELEIILEDSIFALCLDFADKHMNESNELLNKLQNGNVSKRDVSEFNANLTKCLKKQLPILYQFITNTLNSNYNNKCPTMVMRVNEVYFAVVTHVSDLQSMIQELLPEGYAVLTPQEIKGIAKEYSTFE